MAKRRMGRNLDALLGAGAARERTGVDSAARTGNATAADQSSSEAAAIAGDSEPDKRELAGSSDTDASKIEEAEQGAAADERKQKAPQQVPDTTTANSPTPDIQVVGADDHLIMLAVEQIRRGTYQPRRLFDQELLQELADSIKAEGMIQPIIVRPFAGAYELVAGERRWRAAQLAGISQIPAIVRDMEDRSVAAVSVIENIQRKDLNPLEEAAAFERLCDEFGMTHKAVAEAVGRSRASVSNLMRLLELHDEVKVMVDKSQLEMGHARALLGVPRKRQPDIARRVVKQGLTVRAVEKYIRSLDADGNEIPAKGNNNPADPDIDRLSKKLGDKLGAQVRITHKGNGSGNLQIHYSSVSELQGILEHIK